MPERGAVPALIESTFNLSLKSGINGLEFVRLFAGYHPEGWSYSGKAMTGLLTRRFKLMGAGKWDELDEVRNELIKEGYIPQGQWLLAFRKAYPENEGHGPVGIADPSWAGPGGHVLFPVLHPKYKTWRPDFDWAGYHHFHRRANWRWLVEIR